MLDKRLRPKAAGQSGRDEYENRDVMRRGSSASRTRGRLVVTLSVAFPCLLPARAVGAMEHHDTEEEHDWAIPSDLPIDGRDLEMPGGREVTAELSAYLDEKGIRPLLTEIGEMLLRECPTNPVQAIIAHLHQWYPDMCETPSYLAAAPFGLDIIRKQAFCVILNLTFYLFYGLVR